MPSPIRFGAFELGVRSGELRKHGYRVRLPEQSFQVLLMLLEHPGEVVLREEIRQRLWPNNTVVEFDHSINAAIKNLRQALGESGDSPRYVETIPRRGYRFIGELTPLETGVPESIPAGTAEEPSIQPDTLTGKAFSNYRVLDKLGEGGMGVVYRAEDSRLGRFVAIKFLPSTDCDFPDRILRRFEQEARAASALNHPNICTIYGLEQIEGRTAIVMELIDGETLAQRLAKGPLPVEQAVGVAMQIAAALAEAHRNGIVHRDLKPANVMLAKSVVKVLDFGIAKVGSSQEAGTIPGTVFGTLNYLSPEQADGKEADARSDIFSLGVVLHEMLTGKRPSRGDSMATLAGSLARIVRRCLAEAPEDRWQAAEDLQANLNWITEAAEPGSRNRRWMWVAAGSLAVLLGMTAVVIWERPASPAARNWTYSLGPIGEAEVSPDGSAIVHRSPHGVMLRRLDSLDEIPLSISVGDEPCWSADGSRLGFQRRPFGFTRLPLPNGPPEPAESVLGAERGCSWGPDGSVLISALNPPAGLFRLAPDGHDLTRVELPAFKNGRFYRPEFLPDGKHILFAWGGDDDVDVGLFLAGWKDGRVSSEPVLLRRNLMPGHYSPAKGGMLLYVQNDKLYAQKLNVRRGRLEGSPQQIVDGVFSDPVGIRSHFSVSRNGVLVWRAGRVALSELTWFDRTGKVLGTAGPLSYPGWVRLSPDETHVLLRTPTNGSGYSIAEVDRNGVVALKDVDHPIWAPDGAHILFQRKDGSGARIMERTLEGEQEKEITRLADFMALNDISGDGKALLYRVENGLSTIRLDEPQAMPAVAVPGAVQGTFSPDGHWILYTHDDQIYAQHFPAQGLPVQLTVSGGTHPVWRGDGKEVLYLNERDGSVYSLRVEMKNGTLRPGSPQPLFRIRLPVSTGDMVVMAVTRDGSRILFAQGVKQPEPSLTYVMTAWDRVLQH